MDKNFQKQNKLSSELAETMQRMDYELWLFEMKLKKKEVREIFLDFHLFFLLQCFLLCNVQGAYTVQGACHLARLYALMQMSP